MKEIIFVIDQENEESLGKVRHIPGLIAARHENYIWLRGFPPPGAMDKSLKTLPVKNTFLVDESNLLFLPGSLTPFNTLKPLDWQALVSFLPVVMPVAALPGKADKKIKIKIQPSMAAREGAGLLTTLKEWKQYAEMAPGIRLQAIQFALSQKNDVFIIGHPLPSLPGKEYWRQGDIFIPSGFDFEIPAVAGFIEQKTNPTHELISIFNSDGTYQQIEKSFFRQGKRSAVRLTQETNG